MNSLVFLIGTLSGSVAVLTVLIVFQRRVIHEQRKVIRILQHPQGLRRVK